jgi:beta-glucosidase
MVALSVSAFKAHHWVALRRDREEPMSTPTGRTFPPGFFWGAATSAYQVEGAVGEDGRGESIWDRFCRLPGKVRNGEDGAIACDFYHRYPEDVMLMAELGLNAFRFSVAWPRVLPQGRGARNEAGLDFYDRLVDRLLEVGIEPFVTLYHWDLPQALEDGGGWPARQTVAAFVEYVTVVVRRLGDRVRYWITHNEPWVAAWLGYGWGQHAPGRADRGDALRAAHHLLLSHGRAVEAIRALSSGAQVGITLNLTPIHPASDDERDRAAARRIDLFQNRWFLDPLWLGGYPAESREELERHGVAVEAGDEEEIAVPIDFLGVNYYSRAVVRQDPEREEASFVRIPGAQYTDMGWEVYPSGLRELIERLTAEYRVPRLFITENGAAYPDVRGHDGAVRDPERRSYLEAHLAALAAATDAGAPVQGYFVWSLLDNFEWAHGYWKRFGIVYVDYPTLERVPKESARWYRDFIAAQAF